MSDPSTRSSGPTEIGIDTRNARLDMFIKDIRLMLDEKVGHYGRSGGFFETNGNRNYDHAIGEIKLKLSEFKKIGRPRDLIKAAAWLYLIYETEAGLGSRED